MGSESTLITDNEDTRFCLTKHGIEEKEIDADADTILSILCLPRPTKMQTPKSRQKKQLKLTDCFNFETRHSYKSANTNDDTTPPNDPLAMTALTPRRSYDFVKKSNPKVKNTKEIRSQKKSVKRKKETIGPSGKKLMKTLMKELSIITYCQ